MMESAGMQTTATFTPDLPQGNAPAVATLEETKPKPKKSTKPIAGAMVGLIVQFCEHEGDVIPAMLQRVSRVDESLWDVRIFLNGAQMTSFRSGAPFSKTPKPGHWNFLPKS